MFCGIVKDELMIRVGPERYEETLAQAHVRPMDFTGRPMQGYIFVGSGGAQNEEAIKKWIDLGAAFVAMLDGGGSTRSRVKRGADRSSSRRYANVRSGER
jgi:hypothetical protein